MFPKPLTLLRAAARFLSLYLFQRTEEIGGHLGDNMNEQII